MSHPWAWKMSGLENRALHRLQQAAITFRLFFPDLPTKDAEGRYIPMYMGCRIDEIPMPQPLYEYSPTSRTSVRAWLRDMDVGVTLLDYERTERVYFRL